MTIDDDDDVTQARGRSHLLRDDVTGQPALIQLRQLAGGPDGGSNFASRRTQWLVVGASAVLPGRRFCGGTDVPGHGGRGVVYGLGTARRSWSPLRRRAAAASSSATSARRRRGAALLPVSRAGLRQTVHQELASLRSLPHTYW